MDTPCTNSVQAKAANIEAQLQEAKARAQKAAEAETANTVDGDDDEDNGEDNGEDEEEEGSFALKT